MTLIYVPYTRLYIHVWPPTAFADSTVRFERRARTNSNCVVLWTRNMANNSNIEPHFMNETSKGRKQLLGLRGVGGESTHAPARALGQKATGGFGIGSGRFACDAKWSEIYAKLKQRVVAGHAAYTQCL